MNGKRATLEIPADPAYLASARLFVSSLARLYECDEPSVEDLKLAVSEACGSALAAANLGFTRIITTLDEGVFSVEVEDGGVAELKPTDELARVLGLELIRSLFPDAKVPKNARGGYDLHFSVSVQ